jgi:hypothetical protein
MDRLRRSVTTASVYYWGVALTAVIVSAPVDAQTSKANRLASAKRLTCTFPVSSISSWKTDMPQAATKPSTLTLRFEEINSDEGTARVSGMTGMPYEPSEHIIARPGAASLHFIAIEGEHLYLTSAFDDGRDGPLKAVHSRHAFFDVTLPGFTSTPEQYYGNCHVE